MLPPMLPLRGWEGGNGRRHHLQDARQARSLLLVGDCRIEALHVLGRMAGLRIGS